MITALYTDPYFVNGNKFASIVVYTKTTGSPYNNYYVQYCQHVVLCMALMGVNDMHVIHVRSKIVHVYVQLYLLV